MQDIKSLLTYPLMENNHCVGFIGFDSVNKKHAFIDSEIELLKLFSRLLANVTDRRNTEIRLVNESSALKTLFQAIPDLVWIKDPHGVYLSCNARFEDLYGAKESDIVGKKDYDFVDKSLADFFRMHDKAAMISGQQSINEEELSFASDGHKELVQTSKTPVYNDQHHIIGVLGVARDITEIKQTQRALETKERYLRALINNFPFLVWLKDEEGRFLAVNQQFADACNLSSSDALFGKTDLDIWPQALAQAYRNDDAQVMASGKAKNVEELVQSGETLVWMETYKSPVTLDDKMVGTVGFARDISERKMLERNLILERNRFEKYLQTVESIIVSMDAAGHVILINQKGCDLLEYHQEELIGQQWFEFCLPQPDGIERVYPVFLQIMAGEMQGSEYFENSIKTKSGNERLIAWHNTYLTDENGQIIGTLSAGEDITERKKAEDQLRLAASVFTHTHEGIIITSADNIIIDANKAVERITGYSKAELIGKNPRILASGKQSATFYRDLWQTLQSKGFWTGELWNRCKNGSLYAEMITISSIKNDNNEVQGYVALFSDITEHKEHLKRLEYVAHYDALTGLANRTLLSDRLSQAMVYTKRNESGLAVIYLDLDGFKAVNDAYGHENGDKLLSVVADRMKHALREGDTLARLGGDEFVAVLPDLKSHEDCVPFLQRLLTAASEVVNYHGLSMHVSASIGVSFLKPTMKLMLISYYVMLIRPCIKPN